MSWFHLLAAIMFGFLCLVSFSSGGILVYGDIRWLPWAVGQLVASVIFLLLSFFFFDTWNKEKGSVRNE